MFKQIKCAALALVATSAILPMAPPVEAALSKTAQESLAEIQAKIPKEDLIAGRYRRVRRRRVRYRRRPHRRVYRGHRRRVRRPVRVIRRRTCYRGRYETVCRYRTYRR
jgi:hypothetical protein